MKLDKKYFESKQNELAVYRMKLSDALYGELELVVLRQIARDARKEQAGKDKGAVMAINHTNTYWVEGRKHTDEVGISHDTVLAALDEAAKGEQ